MLGFFNQGVSENISVISNIKLRQSKLFSFENIETEFLNRKETAEMCILALLKLFFFFGMLFKQTVAVEFRFAIEFRFTIRWILNKDKKEQLLLFIAKMQRCIKWSPKGVRPRAGLCSIYPSSRQLTQPAGRFAENSIREVWVERRLKILLLFNEGKEKQTNGA